MKLLRASLMAASLVLAVPTAQAQQGPWGTIGPFVEYWLQPYAPNTSTTLFTGDWVSVSGDSHADGNTALTGWGTVDGQGGTGIAKVKVHGEGDGYGVSAWSGWADTIAVQPASPAQFGQHATLRLDLSISWSGTMPAIHGSDTMGSAFVDINLIGTGSEKGYAVVTEDFFRSCAVAGSCGDLYGYGQGSAGTPTFSSGIASFSFDVILGKSYPIVFGMNVAVQGMGSSMTIDASHSMTWGGITSVTSADGLPIAYSVNSDLGLDYTQPLAAVPEAPTAALMLAGLFAVARFRRLRPRA